MVKQQSLKESSTVKSERAQIKSKTYEVKLAYLSSRLFSRSLTPQFLLSVSVSPRQELSILTMEEMRIKTIYSLQTRKAMACAMYETAPTSFNLPYRSHVKKHDSRLLIGRIAFLTCGKSDTRHLIGFHRFANENLLCGFCVNLRMYIIRANMH